MELSAAAKYSHEASLFAKKTHAAIERRLSVASNVFLIMSKKRSTPR